MDYQSNTNKDKLEKAPLSKKKVGRVVKGEVLVQKKGVGRKFKDLFIMADLRSVASYVVLDVMLPAARNLILDASTKGMERLIYGDSVRRRPYGPGPRVTYNSPPSRAGYRDVMSRASVAPPVDPRSRSQKAVREEFILSSREEAETVLERMNDIIDTYEVVSIADFNELVGYPPSPVDNKWGWTFLGDVQVRQIREGYLIDLPPAEPIS